MPTRKIHCEFTVREYGVTGEDIHKWMDAPARNLGISHRRLRHSYDEWVPKKFVRKYELWLAKAIMRSHIWLDNNWKWLKNRF
jgi:hypothetical protein